MKVVAVLSSHAFFFFLVADVSSSFSVGSVAALMAMKNKMKYSRVLDGWDINSVDPCTWNMVGCSSEGFVISL